ncbi:MAG: lipoate--protein ligase [Clostridiales bacterium]|nr:lipoate--protein ligase [Clostridiales bacterium]
MIYRSSITDPFKNLAAEEYLLMRPHDGVDLYVWRNASTVVIGKNQNAWAECNIQALEERDGGHLARRLSGGGAVYHDIDNLNFTFLMPKDEYDLSRQADVILRAVRSLDIDAEKTGRNDLTVQGRKFSGNAFCFRGERAFHHGTLLINTDIEKMLEYLTVDPEKIASKSIASVRSRVINLSELRPGLTTDKMEQALCIEYLKEYGGSSIIHDTKELECEELQRLRAKYASWEWRFGETPKFDMCIKNRAGWGGIEIYLALEEGIITNVAVITDAMDTSIADELEEVLKDCSFRFEDMIKRISLLSCDETIKRNIIEWITE